MGRSSLNAIRTPERDIRRPDRAEVTCSRFRRFLSGHLNVAGARLAISLALVGRRRMPAEDRGPLLP
jgi:hypothetical protein